MSGMRAKAHKNRHKLRCYARQALALALPAAWQRSQRKALLADLERWPDAEVTAILERVAYYHRRNEPFDLGADARRIEAFPREKSWAYYLDLQALLRAFPGHCRFHHRFGDVTETPDRPTFVKSRPLSGDNANAVLLKLNQVRHYYFVRDRHAFAAKEDRLVWRGACHQPHRQAFMARFHDHPRCNLGDTRRQAQGQPWHGEFLSVAEQLRHKFVLSLEGNDVATNLKWIMASNSLCFMRRPRFETWFMEGRLIPDYHYVCLADDYSNLDDKLDYYRHHTDEALAIIANAQRHVAQFRDARRERWVGLLVAQKYFELSGQLSPALRYA